MQHQKIIEIMEEKETRLQKILRQAGEKIGRAILEEIENGEKVEKAFAGRGIIFGGIHICAPTGFVGSKPCVVLKLEQPDIAQLFEPSKEDLQNEADELRKELEKIENKIKTQEK